MSNENLTTPLYSIFIINKSGGLIYHKVYQLPLISHNVQDFVKRKVRLTSNSYLQIAGVFHGMYAITSQLAPTKEVSSGIRSLEADCMKLRCFQSVTGVSDVVNNITI